MEPAYYYIIILSLIAARLIYDTTLSQSAANKTLFEIVKLQAEIKELFERTYHIENPPHLEVEPNKNTGLFARIDHSYNCMMIMVDRCKYLKSVFLSQCDKLPSSYSKKLMLKIVSLENGWITRNNLRDHHKNFEDITKKYIADYYNATRLPMLEFTDEFFKENSIEKIKRPDGSIIDKEKINQDMDKWHLNKKLKEKLPPKAKAKVNKI